MSETHLYGCPKCRTKTELPVEPKNKCPVCRTKLVWLHDSRDMPDGKPNLELIHQLELKSDKFLSCKGCGSKKFNILESKAYSDYKSMFAVVYACAECGLVANATNNIGHTDKHYMKYDKEPIDNQYVECIASKKKTSAKTCSKSNCDQCSKC